MTGEFRSLRILLVPVALLLVFFIITPRMCARAVTRAKQQKAEAPAAPTATSAGLKIASSNPRTAAGRSAAFPSGLDAARIQYLVEIDPQFSAPRMAALPKTFNASDDVTTALVKMQYAENQPDGSTALTREGALNLKLTEQDDQWTFPVATRVFDRITNLSRVEDDRYDATFTWHWEPTQVGAALKMDRKTLRTATAQLAGGERHWALAIWIAPASDIK